jgi:ferric-dicitrate binding protein FerR (iron transport regulator)
MNQNITRPSEKAIESVLNELATQEEAACVAAWFGTADGQYYLSQVMGNDFENIKEHFENVAVNHPIPSEEMYRYIMRCIRRKKMRRYFFRAAAILLPLLLLGGLFQQLNSRVDLLGGGQYEEVRIPKGERVQFLFQDGSKAYINADSKIRYPKQFGLTERKIYLEGEAYFVVTPNARRPFVVEMEKNEIHVLGTSFNVKAYPEDQFIDVMLDEGKINLKSWTQKDHLLSAGEKLIYDKRNDTYTIIKVADTKSASLWKNDVIAFRNASLQEVITALNRWYNVEFVVEDQRAHTYLYTMTSDNTLLEKVLQDLEKIAPVRFTLDNGTVKVSMLLKEKF